MRDLVRWTHTRLVFGQDLDAFEAGEEHKRSWKYYPDEFSEPYKSRRRKVGWDLYGLLGIAKGEKEKMHAQHRRNYQFFDAPVGLMFTIARVRYGFSAAVGLHAVHNLTVWTLATSI